MRSVFIIVGAIALIVVLKYLSIYSEKMKAGTNSKFISKKDPEDTQENIEDTSTEK